MRSIDLSRTVYQKAAKTINFDKMVLIKLEEHCRKHGFNVSTFVNSCIKKKVLKERDFLRALAKHHSILFHKYRHLIEISESFSIEK